MMETPHRTYSGCGKSAGRAGHNSFTMIRLPKSSSRNALFYCDVWHRSAATAVFKQRHKLLYNYETEIKVSKIQSFIRRHSEIEEIKLYPFQFSLHFISMPFYPNNYRNMAC